MSASSVEKSGKRVPMIRTASSSSLTSLSAEKTLKSKLLTGITSFLPSKPKAPTQEELQRAKEEKIKEKERERQEQMREKEEGKKRALEEKRAEREEKARRVEENRKQQVEEKRAEREEKIRRAEEANLRAKQDKERERKAAATAAAAAKTLQLDQFKKMHAERLEADRKKKEELDQEKKRLDEERRKRKEAEAAAEAARQKAEAAKKENLNETYDATSKAAGNLNSTYNLNATYEKAKSPPALSKAQQNVSSYDITPARHELPPEDLVDPNNYNIGDLKSDDDTDDEDDPRKKIPSWANGVQLRNLLLKQCYIAQDLDDIFTIPEMPQLERIFVQQKRRFYKRTSSAQWGKMPTSNNLPSK